MPMNNMVAGSRAELVWIEEPLVFQRRKMSVTDNAELSLSDLVKLLQQSTRESNNKLNSIEVNLAKILSALQPQSAPQVIPVDPVANGGSRSCFLVGWIFSKGGGAKFQLNSYKIYA